MAFLRCLSRHGFVLFFAQLCGVVVFDIINENFVYGGACARKKNIKFHISLFKNAIKSGANIFSSSSFMMGALFGVHNLSNEPELIEKNLSDKNLKLTYLNLLKVNRKGVSGDYIDLSITHKKVVFIVRY